MLFEINRELKMRNPRIANVKTEIIAKNRFTLKRVTNDYQKKDGSWETQVREIFEKEDGATILLYNREKRTIILTRQFRMPTFLNENESGMLIEACAGLVEEGDPENCARKESIEETGYEVSEVKKVFEAYMSPGAVTSLLHCFIAPYTNEMKISEGGGHDHEQENIEVLEMSFDEAYQMLERGEIRDGKTIMLLQYAKINNLV